MINKKQAYEDFLFDNLKKLTEESANTKRKANKKFLIPGSYGCQTTAVGELVRRVLKECGVKKEVVFEESEQRFSAPKKGAIVAIEGERSKVFIVLDWPQGLSADGYYMNLSQVEIRYGTDKNIRQFIEGFKGIVVIS